MAPRDLMIALDLNPSVLDLVKFDPDQPRVPAGMGWRAGSGPVKHIQRIVKYCQTF